MNEQKKRGRPKREDGNKLKVNLRIKRQHPTNRYPLREHVVTNELQEYELDQEAYDLLDTTEYKYWIEKVGD